ncbi:hypothetical protein D3C87_103610 [compost metagenome]
MMSADYFDFKMALSFAMKADMPRKRFDNHTEFPYHITARCINRDWFAIELNEVWDVMTKHLLFISLAYEIRIHAFVLMNNHFHLIATSPLGNLSEAMWHFMRESGLDLRKISGRINQTYGGRFHRSLINSPLYFQHAYKYVYRNPVEAGLCAKVEDYPYSSLRGLLGLSSLDISIKDDDFWGSFDKRESALHWLNARPQHEHWLAVEKALSYSHFKLRRENARKSILETNAL